MQVVTMLGVLSWLPALSTALTIGDVMRNSINAFATQGAARQELEERSLLSDILADIKNLTECSSCEVSGVSDNYSADRTLMTDLPMDSIGVTYCSQSVGSLGQQRFCGRHRESLPDAGT